MVRGMHRVKAEMNSTNENIGARARLFLRDRSAAWLGEQLGMSRQNAARLLKGEIEWRVETIAGAARALGVRMADLMPDSVATPQADEMAILSVFRTGGYRALIALALTHLSDP
jgi:hypothetical protein